jgi:hypothetical protein
MKRPENTFDQCDICLHSKLTSCHEYSKGHTIYEYHCPDWEDWNE